MSVIIILESDEKQINTNPFGMYDKYDKETADRIYNLIVGKNNFNPRDN